MKQLATADDVIEALGGTDAVMAMTGAKQAQSVSNWRVKNQFPAKTYAVMTAALAARGCAAPASLWSQIGASQETADA